ncbi:hypothetical protein TSOC_012237 [Tetrabaena socialis]|uniref:Uncharacterized protein n=1 Tax=Tetrabaena socialis TaxID=47790 RepID=A0A2J7ZNJ9_9CHLO|nr:hypothetical protein TSOC_012237 [Tetrabaena socialis]|eukprot:PNH01835.1 hypothetical protein TSOC_012237 [Tetrabaena socialis]
MAADGGGDETPESFADLLLSEVRSEGLDCPSVQMLIGMAKAGDSDTVADALSYLVEAGSPDLAAECLRRIMGAPAPPPKAGAAAAGAPAAAAAPAAGPAPGGKPPPLDYAAAGKILNRRVRQHGRAADEARGTAAGVGRPRHPPRNPRTPASSNRAQNVSMLLGSMVPEDAADSAGRLLFALYSSAGAEAARGASDDGAAASDAAASQTLVPFILGTLLDHDRAAWATELAKQLMYTTLEWAVKRPKQP